MVQQNVKEVARRRGSIGGSVGKRWKQILTGYAFIAPVVLGLILGEMFEEQFRRAVKLGGGTLSRFYTSPICWVFILLVVVIIASTVMRNRREGKNA